MYTEGGQGQQGMACVDVPRGTHRLIPPFTGAA